MARAQTRAQFPAWCENCSNEIVVGAAISRTTRGWVHHDCSKPEGDPELIASPQRQRVARRAGELAMWVMARASFERGAPVTSWRDKLPTHVRNVACSCESQNLDFEANPDPVPHWDVICRVCGEVTSFPRSILRSISEGRGW